MIIIKGFKGCKFYKNVYEFYKKFDTGKGLIYITRTVKIFMRGCIGLMGIN